MLQPFAEKGNEGLKILLSRAIPRLRGLVVDHEIGGALFGNDDKCFGLIRNGWGFGGLSRTEPPHAPITGHCIVY